MTVLFGLIFLLVGGLVTSWTGQAASASSLAAGAAAAAPKKKAPASWKTIRTERFSASSLPSGCTPYAGRFTAGSNVWSKKEVKVAKGALNLSLEKKTTSGRPYTSGGLACLGWAQKYGRYEVRARVPAGKGIDSTIALWPANPKLAAWTGLELLAPGPDTAYVTNGYSSTRVERTTVDSAFASRYHVYVIEWSPKQVRMTIDGKQIYYSANSFNGKRWFALVVSNGDPLTGVPDAGTVLPASFQIDSVKMSSYTGVPPKVPAITAPVPTPSPSGTPSSTSTAVGTATSTPGTGALGATTTTSPTATSPTAASTVAGALAGSTDRGGPTLAGGIWPWLLGGSLIAGCAVLTLNYPGHKRARERAAAGRQSN